MEAPKTILIVDDEPHILMGLQDSLEFEGFRICTAQNGQEALEVFQQESPDAVLLDLMLPDENGYVVCQRIREISLHVPVIMLTAKSQEADKIRGLDAGADDYVTKPFSVGELTARLRALFRRAAIAPGESEQFKVGEASFNLGAHTYQVGQKEGPLSFYEVELMRLLYERRGQSVARDDILEKVWGLEKSPSNRTIDNFIVKLRKKVEKKPNKPKHILTMYGHGYKLVL